MTVELRSGDPAPAFDALDADGQRWTLDALGGKRVILYFYPADFTPG